MTSRRSARAPEPAKDPESLESLGGKEGHQYAAADSEGLSLKENNKPAGPWRRIKCSHILVVAFLLVMSLDAFIQLNANFNADEDSEVVELDLAIANQGAAASIEPVGVQGIVAEGSEVASAADPHNGVVESSEESNSNHNLDADEAVNLPRTVPPVGAAAKTHSKASRARRKGRGDSVHNNRPRTRAHGGGGGGGDGDDQQGENGNQNGSDSMSSSSGDDLKHVVGRIFDELHFTPTFCASKGHNISSVTLMTKSSVDSNNKVHYEKGGSRARLQLEEDFVRQLPRSNFLENRNLCHSTCAIVGNSGTMLSKNQGEEIDSHEAVLRINYPPIHRFEKNVGSKTTYDFSNRENARRMLRSRMRWRNPRTTVIFFEGSSPVNRRSIFGPLLRKHPEQDFEFLHPQFVNSAQSFWSSLKGEMEQAKGVQYHNKPMSGIFAVLFMLQICEQVDVYGFEAYTKRTKETPYHYFDSVKVIFSLFHFKKSLFPIPFTQLSSIIQDWCGAVLKTNLARPGPSFLFFKLSLQGVTSVHSFDLAIEVYKSIGAVLPLSLK